MSTAELRRKIKKKVDKLNPKQLRTTEDFLDNLDTEPINEATRELLAIPGLLKAVRQADRDFREGRGVPVEKLRRKY